MLIALELVSMIAPPDFTLLVMGIAGPEALPWKNVAELAFALKVPPLKLKVAVGTGPAVGGPDCEALVAQPTRLQTRVPPAFKLTVPWLPEVLPAALRDM